MTQLTATTEQQRFASLWHRNSQDSNDTSQLWLAIVKHYSEQHRYYHNISHIQHCLQQLDLIKTLSQQDHDAIELAIYFHDIIHGRDKQDDEKLSAEYFSRHAEGNLPTALIAVVKQLICVTTHTDSSDNPIEQYMMDIDLSSFGFDWLVFLKDSEDLRKENKNVPDREFYAGKKQFLLKLLARDQIFYSKLFHELYENKARRNIEKYLKMISTWLA